MHGGNVIPIRLKLLEIVLGIVCPLKGGFYKAPLSHALLIGFDANGFTSPLAKHLQCIESAAPP